jgi:hypothetical protein
VKRREALRDALENAEQRFRADPGDRVAEVAYLRVVAMALTTLVEIQIDVQGGVLSTMEEWKNG